MYDSMRGLVTEGNDLYLQADEDDAEVTNADYLKITPTGFEINTSNSNINEEWSTYVFLAIRRPDGYVGKPPELGTDVFAMDTGNASSTIPAFDSNFPVDFIFQKEPASSSDNWYTGSRLTGSTNGSLNLGSAFGNWTDMVWDSNVGVTKNMTSSTQGWMFKRHAGFDVVTYVGDGVAGRHLPHSMNKAPEMVWIKLIDRDNHNWVVGHKGLDGGTNPWHKYLWLNTNDDEADGTWPWNDTAPTANHLVLGNGGTSNGDAAPYIAMLFASVAGISKVGYYSGSNSSQTISTGFAPRFLIMKKVDTEQGWVVLDTVRGWGSGDDERLEFHNNSAQNDSIDFGAPTSSGFTLTGNVEKSNQSGGSYIYYAHA